MIVLGLITLQITLFSLLRYKQCQSGKGFPSPTVAFLILHMQVICNCSETNDSTSINNTSDDIAFFAAI